MTGGLRAQKGTDSQRTESQNTYLCAETGYADLSQGSAIGRILRADSDVTEDPFQAAPMASPTLGSHTAAMGTQAHTKVFIAEDFLPVRQRLTELLISLDEVDIVGEAETPKEAVSGIIEQQPDWVVLDFDLRGGTCVEVLRLVHAKAPAVRFIVLSNYPTPQYRRICMESGAGWFFDKSTEFGKVKDVITGLVAAND
jgi:CheY-like chemotaxis protein